MWINSLYLLVALALLARGGGLFVDASSQLSRVLRIPRIVIGGTIVSIATTVPELLTSVQASLQGDTGMALGNAVGSCITNIGLIAGVVAIIMPIEFDRSVVLKRSAWMVLGAVLVVFFSWDLTMSRTYAAALLFLAALYLAWDVVGVIRSRADMNDRTADDNPKTLNAVGRFLLGAVFVTFGSWLLVETGQDIAKFIGVSSEVIGLSVVAFGTSLPELVTGVTAARRGMSDLSLGNIIGANVLNLLLIVGASGAITPLVLKPVSQQYAFPWLGLFFAVLLGVVIRHGVIRRAAGIGFLLLFTFFAIGLFVQ